jgi:uncharacterized protein (TIGR00299 family) protein
MSEKKQIVYLDCHSGISGDMFLGALLDAGLSFDTLSNSLVGLPIDDFRLETGTYEDKGIRGTRFNVVVTKKQPERHRSDIATILNGSALPERVRETALSIFQCLAEAEATVHGTTIEQVHFHEVGAVDAIVDIVGAAIGIEELGITQIYASPLPLTSGHVKTAHGLLPVPAPATLEILRRVSAPWKACPAEGELVTPTGAAILATLARFETPAIAIERVGYGFGQKRMPWPNCLRLCIGRDYSPLSSQRADADTDWVTVIESHIDNMSGELLGGLMQRLFTAGALDVSYTPIQMKKNRPATLITIIAPTELADTLALLMLRETTTLGVRIQHMQRLKAQRTQQQIETPYGPLSIKIKRLGERIISASPEYEDCQRIATERDLPLSEVYEAVQQAALSALQSLM